MAKQKALKPEVPRQAVAVAAVLVVVVVVGVAAAVGVGLTINRRCRRRSQSRSVSGIGVGAARVRVLVGVGAGRGEASVSMYAGFAARWFTVLSTLLGFEKCGGLAFHLSTWQVLFYMALQATSTSCFCR